MTAVAVVLASELRSTILDGPRRIGNDVFDGNQFGQVISRLGRHGQALIVGGLAARARRKGVDLVPGMAPGLTFDYTSAADYRKLLAKLAGAMQASLQNAVSLFAAPLAQTARALWLVYLGLTLLCILSLRLAGMDWFDAVCHAFSAMSPRSCPSSPVPTR